MEKLEGLKHLSRIESNVLRQEWVPFLDDFHKSAATDELEFKVQVILRLEGTEDFNDKRTFLLSNFR